MRHPPLFLGGSLAFGRKGWGKGSGRPNGQGCPHSDPTRAVPKARTLGQRHLGTPAGYRAQGGTCSSRFCGEGGRGETLTPGSFQHPLRQEVEELREEGVVGLPSPTAHRQKGSVDRAKAQGKVGGGSTHPGLHAQTRKQACKHTTTQARMHTRTDMSASRHACTRARTHARRHTHTHLPVHPGVCPCTRALPHAGMLLCQCLIEVTGAKRKQWRPHGSADPFLSSCWRV